MKRRITPMATSLEIFNTLTMLRAQLRAKYGDDFSFQVLARGNYLAASSVGTGEILPAVLPAFRT